MKLYVCYSALKNVKRTGRPGGHPCGNAHVALKEAGHDVEVEAVGGLAFPPLNRTAGRKKVQELTGGSSMVPVLVTDDGEVIQESARIIEWAEANAAA